MANDFYDPQTDVLAGGLVRAATINALDSAVDAAFDLLPSRDTTTGGGHKGFSTPVLVGSPTHSKHAVPLGYLNSLVVGQTATGTSSTTVTVGTGSKTFAIAETGRSWQADMRLEAVSGSDPNKLMQGTVTSYASNSLVLAVDSVDPDGSGDSANDWVIYPISTVAVTTISDNTFDGENTFVGNVILSGTTTISDNTQNELGNNIPTREWAFRNGFLNPGFEIDSVNRGAAAYEHRGTDGAVETIDGWFSEGESGSMFTVQRIAGGPDGQRYYARISVTLDNGLNPATHLHSFYGYARLPGLIIGSADAEYITVRFKMRSSIGTGNYAFRFTFGGITEYYVAKVALVGTGWQTVTITIPPLTSATGTFNGTIIGIFDMGSGSNFATSAGDEWESPAVPYSPLTFSGAVAPITVASATIDFAKMQIERGSVATQFEDHPYDIERLRLQAFSRRVFDGRVGGLSGNVCPFPAYRRGTDKIVVLIPVGDEGPGTTFNTVANSAPTWHSSDENPSGDTVGAMNLASGSMITITGALSWSITKANPGGILLTLTAGTSFSGAAGDPVLIYFGEEAYAYVRT